MDKQVNAPILLLIYLFEINLNSLWSNVAPRILKVYSHNLLLTLLSAAIGSFNAERPIKILWLIGLIFTSNEKLKNQKTVCGVYRTGQTKKTKKLKTLKTSS